MQTLTLNKAAKLCGRSKATLLEAIKSGRLSAPKNERGHYTIEPSELHRVYPYNSPDQTPDRSPEPQPTPQDDHENRIEIARLEAALEAEKRLTGSLTDQVADLRTRLDQEGEERRALSARLLADQRPATTPERPSFWRGIFRRAGNQA